MGLFKAMGALVVVPPAIVAASTVPVLGIGAVIAAPLLPIYVISELEKSEKKQKKKQKMQNQELSTNQKPPLKRQNAQLQLVKPLQPLAHPPEKTNVTKSVSCFPFRKTKK